MWFRSKQSEFRPSRSTTSLNTPMAKKKTPAKATTDRSTQSQSVKSDDDPLPFSQYIPLTVIHSLLLMFAMLVLPRSTLTFKELPLQTSSLDRPQSEFMAPITAWPAVSVLWMCVGVALTQTYWSEKAAGWIKSDYIKENGANKEEVEVVQADRSSQVRAAPIHCIYSHLF